MEPVPKSEPGRYIPPRESSMKSFVSPLLISALLCACDSSTTDDADSEASFVEGNSNVASVEERGAECIVPALEPFLNLTEHPLLHDPFESLAGERITAKSDWTCRRAEISAQVQE